MNKTSPRVFMAAALLLGLSQTSGLSQIANGSFETGNFDDWTTTGRTKVAGPAFATTPTSSFQGVVATSDELTSFIPGATVTAATLSKFFGGVVLPGNMNGVPTDGSGFKQTFTVATGGSLSFDYKILTNEELGSGWDRAFYVLDGKVVTLGAPSLAMTKGLSTANKPPDSTFEAATIYLKLTISGLKAGTHTIGFGVYDTGDMDVTSGLSITDLIGMFAAPVPSQENFLDFALTHNQRAVAGALNNEVILDHGADFKIVLANLDSVIGNQLPGVFDELSPASLAPMTEIPVAYADTQFSNLLDRFDSLRAGSTGFNGGFSISDAGNHMNWMSADQQPIDLMTGKETKEVKPSVMRNTPDNRWGVFAAGAGTFGDIQNNADRSGANFDTGGVTIGVDYRVLDNLALGIFGGYAGSEANILNGGHVSVNSGNFGLYGTYFQGGFYANGVVSGAGDEFDTTRNIQFSKIDRSARGNTDGTELNARLGTGYDLAFGRLSVGPTEALEYSHVNAGSFVEHDAGALDLGINQQTVDSLKNNLGARASYAIALGGGKSLVPMVSVEWQHAFSGTDYDIIAALQKGAGTPFSVRTASIGHDSVLVRAGFTVNLSQRVSTYLTYEGNLAASNYQIQSVQGGISVQF